MMKFGFRYLRQALFGEISIPVKPAAERERLRRVRERGKDAVERASKIAEDHDRMYESLE